VQFEFALVNLVLNARDTINGEGRIGPHSNRKTHVARGGGLPLYPRVQCQFLVVWVHGDIRAGATARCPNYALLER
jgi:hypothetical protein